MTSLLHCTKPEGLSKEKLSILIIVLAIFKETNGEDLTRVWEEAVSKICMNALLPLWQKTALSIVEYVFLANEVQNEAVKASTESKADSLMTTHRAVIPDGVKGGEAFLVTVEGLRFKAVCPSGHSPGMSLLIRVPKKPEQPLSSPTPTFVYELDLPQGVQPEQVINVKVKDDKVVKVKCPPDIAAGDSMRFTLQATLDNTVISATTLKLSELKPSSVAPSMPMTVDPWSYLRNLIKASLTSEAAISVLDYAEIFLYSNSERSVQTAMFFAEIAQHVLNTECGVVKNPTPVATASSIIKSYCLVKVEKLNENEKISWNCMVDEVRSFLTSHCIQTCTIQLAQYRHKQLSQLVEKFRLPVTCNFSQCPYGRKWRVALTKTASVSWDSGGVNLCSCNGNTWCSGNMREKGPCQATILNPNIPLEKNKPKAVVPKKKIDPDQIRTLLVHFENISKGIEVESEIEIVAPPQKAVALVEVLD